VRFSAAALISFFFVDATSTAQCRKLRAKERSLEAADSSEVVTLLLRLLLL